MCSSPKCTPDEFDPLINPQFTLLRAFLLLNRAPNCPAGHCQSNAHE
jgi:hypothetical protein